MKKILLVLLVILVIGISGCKKEVQYYCQISGIEVYYEHWLVIDSYEKTNDGIYKLYSESNDHFYEYDSEEMEIFCIEMEKIK